MIAYHFPPQRGSSGIQRTLRFARYLPEFGWTPAVLTVHPRAYEEVDGSEAPPDLRVRRATAFDAARHFAIRGKYPGIMAVPDRWASWWWGAVPAGLKLVREWRPNVLWSTYPIATAHAIGHTLARLTGLPWVADFRDPMAQDGYPPDRKTWQAFAQIEARTVTRARRSIFATPGAAREYRARYPAHADRIRVIENGYDEELFAGLPKRAHDGPRQPFVLLHSGIVYPWERDPTAFFAALAKLASKGTFVPGSFVVRFRAPVHESKLRELTTRFCVSDFVEIAPSIPYRDALAEMLAADALVVLQAANCNEQIPAKFYEYLRAGRPVLGLADPHGDTGQAMRAAGIPYLAALEDGAAIQGVLTQLLDDLRRDVAALPDASFVRGASRRTRSSDLAKMLDEVTVHSG